MKNRNEYPHLLNKLNLNRGVEVGSFKGQFAKHILENWGGELYLIDVWRELSDDEYNDASNMKFHGETYVDTINNIKNFEDRAYMLRMKSEQASILFCDNSLDFVYIDANHTYESVKQDIRLWFPKVKKGGIISGHDYLDISTFNQTEYDKGNKNQHIWMWPDGDEENKTYAGLFGVNPAVDEFIKEYKYDLNVTNDFMGTWWFIK